MKKRFLILSFLLLLAPLFCDSKIEFYFVNETETETLANFRKHSDLPIEGLLDYAQNNFPNKAVGLHDYSTEESPLYDVIILDNDEILNNDSIKEISAKNEIINYSIQIELTPTGSEYFEELTKENIGRKIAILVNDEVIFCARLIEAITGGKISIGPFDYNSAKRLTKNFEYDFTFEDPHQKSENSFINIYQIDTELSKALVQYYSLTINQIYDATEMINTIFTLNKSTKLFFDYNEFYKIACEPEVLLTREDIISVSESDINPEIENGDYYFENYTTLKLSLNKKAQNKIKKLEKSIPFEEDSDGNKSKPFFLFCSTSDNYNFVLDFKDNNLFIYYASPEDLEHLKNLLN